MRCRWGRGGAAARSTVRSTDRALPLALPLALLLALLPGLFAPAAGAAQWVSPVTLGSPEEDRLRVGQILGRSELDGFLVRSPRVLPIVGGEDGWHEVEMGPDRGMLRVAGVLPEVVGSWNSEIPLSMNDGLLWAGRGRSVLVRGGLALEIDRVRVIFLPEFTYSENLGFDILASEVPGRSPFSASWFSGRHSADIPLRFGDDPVLVWSPGQSSVTVDLGPVDVGFATENMWWGPGLRNGLVLSNHAGGFPHAFLGTDDPLETTVGRIEARWIVGTLTESLHFDTRSPNGGRSLAGVIVTFSPSVEPNLTLGASRVVMTPDEDVLSATFRPFFDWEGPADAMDEGEEPDSDQIFALFFRWVLPEDGFEVWGEWARSELPADLGELFEAPHHSQALTVGLQWVRPLSSADGEVRLQGEVTTLEQTKALPDRPVASAFYTGRASEQGFTHRGQVLGAAIGPGSSSQWIAADYLAPRWRAGIFGNRVRWQNDLLLTQVGLTSLRHDVSLIWGFRGGVESRFGAIDAEIAWETRYNYLFQNGEANPLGIRTVDIDNLSVSFHLRPSLP